jgi:nucleotide-binding universal stress UspA family protein
VQTLRRSPPREEAIPVANRGRRPILLATIEAPFDERAATFAVESAVECGQPLIVANVVQIPLGPLCVGMGYGSLEPGEAEAANLRAPAELASTLGVAIERLRVLSPHPVPALLELVSERRPGLLVFGPDRAKLKPRSYRRAAKRIADKAACLVWLAD